MADNPSPVELAHLRNKLAVLQRDVDRFKKALEAILNMPFQPIWDDDRDDAAEMMLGYANDALNPKKKRR